MGDPFCSSDDSSITIRHTLRGWLATALNEGRLDEDSASYARELLEDSGAGRRLLRRITVAARARPERIDLQVLQAVAARAAHERESERDALRLAFADSPDTPAIAWATADAFRDSAEVALALEAIRRYLSLEKIPALARMAARLEVEHEITHAYATLERAGITLHYPPELMETGRAERLLEEVVATLEESGRVLAKPRRRLLTVTVYPGREEILAVTCARAWAAAVYDGKLRVAFDPSEPLGVGRTVLRHESMHAAMAGLEAQVPLWFDEGVAQWFAGEERQQRSNWGLMVKHRSYIPLPSLEGSFQAFEAHEDASLAYGESLGLVAWSVERGGAGALARAVSLFGTGATSERVMDDLSGGRFEWPVFLTFLEQRLAR